MRVMHCIAFGETAGTAAALAVKDRIRVRGVNLDSLSDRLIKQGVILPDV
jgi:hypothetical protein